MMLNYLCYIVFNALIFSNLYTILTLRKRYSVKKDNKAYLIGNFVCVK